MLFEPASNPSRDGCAFGRHLPRKRRERSVGWLGAVVTFLALAIAGLASEDGDTVRSAYIAMESIGWSVLVPLSLASLVTGVVQALGTAWGLFRHYWVVFKLLINVATTFVLLLYVPNTLRSPSPLIHSALALLLLLVAMVLAVYRPREVTPRGQRRRQGEDPPRQA